MSRQQVSSEYGLKSVKESIVEETSRSDLAKPQIRSIDEALQAAIVAGVRIDPRRERVTPEALGLTKEEAAEYGRQFVLALLSREVGRYHDDPIDAEYWAHVPTAVDIAPGMVQVACSCTWTGNPAGKYVAYEEHAQHRAAHIEVINARYPGGYETHRSQARRFVPQGARRVRGAGEVQHPDSETLPADGFSERVLEREVGPGGNVASDVLPQRRPPVWPYPEPEGPGADAADPRRAAYWRALQSNSPDPSPSVEEPPNIEFYPVPFTGQGMGT